jgi:sec-independent protein translocase protein TatC
MSAFIRALTNNKTNEDELGGQMSFLEHLDELRKRLIRSFIFVFLAASISWFFADRIYSFLAVPVERHLPRRKEDKYQSPVQLVTRL